VNRLREPSYFHRDDPPPERIGSNYRRRFTGYTETGCRGITGYRRERVAPEIPCLRSPRRRESGLRELDARRWAENWEVPGDHHSADRFVDWGGFVGPYRPFYVVGTASRLVSRIRIVLDVAAPIEISPVGWEATFPNVFHAAELPRLGHFR
jgi:hypothetical protein